MSGDGPKAAPGAIPLDEIILGDDDTETAPQPPVAPKAAPSGPPPPPDESRRSSKPKDRQSNRSLEAKKKKMTLRIPDDEVSRPQLPSSATPAAGVPALRPSTRPAVATPPSPDDTLELPPQNEVRARMHALTDELEHTNGDRRVRDSEEIPVELDGGLDSASDQLATSPRLPIALDSEDIKLEEGDRLTEPDPDGDSEIDAADLVSVESIPTPPPPPQKVTGKMPAVKIPSSPGVSAVAPQAPVPAAAPSAPREQAPPKRQPSSPAILVPPVGALAPPPMTDSAAMRKKTRPWWEELFNDDFIRTMARVTDGQIRKEVDFIEESLGCEAGAMVLDLACGTGRHAVELATRGYQVVGFDLSLAMLARASDEAQDRGQKINFVQGDMRDMTFEETFDGVYSWNTSFGFFDEEKNGGVVAKVHRALKKGGQFLLDVVNRDYIVRQAPSLAWFEGDGCICMDEMQIDFITSRMRVKRTLMMDDGRTKEIEYSVRVYALHELGKLLHDNGFRVAEVSGRTATPGVFFGCESPRTLILAEKR
jgi:SAM-dependent methyltransferase